MRLPGATHRNVYVSSEAAAKRVLAGIGDWIERHLRLRVNRVKSGAGRPWERKFLGFRINRRGQREVAPQSVARFKQKVREIWRSCRSVTSRELRDEWRRYVVGWWGYYRLAQERRNVFRLEGWIRRHMRKCFWLRWHGEARPPESVTAAGGERAAAACGIDASGSLVYGTPRVAEHGVVERHSEALRVCGAIESCGERVKSLGPTAGYGKPYVRWCGRVPGRNPRHPTRSSASRGSRLQATRGDKRSPLRPPQATVVSATFGPCRNTVLKANHSHRSFKLAESTT